MKNTNELYDIEFDNCRNLFFDKFKDYGTSWRIMRPTSLTDQIFIKAQRIKFIEQIGYSYSKIDDSIYSEYIGIINYGIIGLIQLEMLNSTKINLSLTEVESLYSKYYKNAKELMINKNHDYGEAWRDMRISSLTDLILMKIHRTKQIEDNDGSTIISEGIDANYYDMINYAVFSLIKLNTQN